MNLSKEQCEKLEDNVYAFFGLKACRPHSENKSNRVTKEELQELKNKLDDILRRL